MTVDVRVRIGFYRTNKETHTPDVRVTDERVHLCGRKRSCIEWVGKRVCMCTWVKWN